MNENLLQNERHDTTNLADEKIAKAVKDARIRLADNTQKTDNSSLEPEKITKGKGRGKSTTASGARKASTEEIQRMSHELDKMFNAENFRGLVRAPADLLLALTGNKIWDIPHDEVETLSVTGATCARYFLSSDPKWLALTLFSMAFLTTYGTRAAIHLSALKGDKSDKKT